MMVSLPLSADDKVVNFDKASLKFQYKALESRTDEKFEAWMMTVEDQWLEEIKACLQGKFPDWR